MMWCFRLWWLVVSWLLLVVVSCRWKFRCRCWFVVIWGGWVFLLGLRKCWFVRCLLVLIFC